MLFLCVVVFAAPLAAFACPKYMCNPANSPYPLSSGMCVFFDAVDYYLQTCPRGQFCPGSSLVFPGSLLCEPNPTPQPLQSKAGDPCFQDSDCAATGYFFDGVACNKTAGRCLGLGLGGNCKNVGNSVCNPGLYCLGGMCLPQKDSGATCVSDSMCQTNFGCNFGKCQPYFSFPEGTSVSDCLNFVSFFCQTGSCYKGKCMSLVANVNFLPQVCVTKSDCVGVSLTKTTEMYQSECLCGKNPQGWGFCQPFSGDSPGMRYIEAARNLLYSNATISCNAGSRFSWSCLGYAKDAVALEFVISQMNYARFAELQMNDDCVKQIFTESYWRLASAIRVTLSILLLGSILA